MPDLVLLLGPCGAGKTTYARLTYPHHFHVDMDRLVQTLYADPSLFRYHAVVRTCGKLLEKQAAQHLLGKQQNVCLPVSGTTRRERHQWIDLAHAYGASVHCVLLVVNQETAIRRAKADTSRPPTSKSKWRAIIEHWFRAFEPVDRDMEGIETYREVDNNE